jgi:hypothetical protein
MQLEWVSLRRLGIQLKRGVQSLQGLAQALPQTVARFRQFDLGAIASKQGFAAPVLHRLDVATDGTVGQMAFGGSLGKAA